ncbi:MAG: helix-turn-helix transcriptional regulator [Myxococcales bacterium]|nr:helix-turn-helix transcriptional regulator [Myxococcales bacterium]MDD9972298.1 helix-turn-helix transcriptional regulator [Myxococcales bacterium]
MEPTDKSMDATVSSSKGSAGAEPEESEATPRASVRAKKASESGAKSTAKAHQVGKNKADRQADKPTDKTVDKKQAKARSNRVRETRIERMMSKAELARRAGLSVLTIDRVEKGLGCRMDTKRKILEALGLSLADRVRVFGEEE